MCKSFKVTVTPPKHAGKYRIHAARSFQTGIALFKVHEMSPPGGRDFSP